MNLKDTYNKIAQDWYQEVVTHNWAENGMKHFMDYLNRGDLILDVGCGPGISAKTFIENGFRVVGIDFSEKMIEIAKEKCLPETLEF